LVSKNGYDGLSSPPGVALRMGNNNADKFRFQIASGFPGMDAFARYTAGSRGVNLGGSARSWAVNYASKACWANSKATYGGYWNTPYTTDYTAIDNTTGYTIASQLLTGSGATTIGTDWRGFISAVLIYNRILNPTEYRSISNYYYYRKLI
jgi:hypothetical protein